jgi:penicillin-binding protein 1B
MSNPITRSRAILLVCCLILLAAGTFNFFYLKYARIIDKTLRGGTLEHSSTIFAAPRLLTTGDPARVEDLALSLRRSGYSNSKSEGIGWYELRPGEVVIHPGPEAYTQEPVALKTEGGQISQIRSLRDGGSRTEYPLEPEPVTNVFDGSREKKLVVPFDALPKVLVNAVLAAEDKRFFRHSGFDAARIVRALWVDLRQHRNVQGASTLTQQLARTLWLGPERGWHRKIPETLITMHLEQALTKQQILADYANSIYLGHVGSFAIRGFAKASQAYLAKDLSQVTLPEAAMLAGLIQAPYTRNPFRYPERAKARRDTILNMMREDGFITPAEFHAAQNSPLRVQHGESDTSDAPYFVDLVNESLQNDFDDYDFQSTGFRVYSTLDTDLQRDAVEAMRVGIQETDRQLKKQWKDYGGAATPLAQVALVALDAQTGAVKALLGGRSYSTSQLDRALSKRQPGSSFKPFVYAAAFNGSLNKGGPVLTPATTVDDTPTTFMFNGKAYQPSDFESGADPGPVTLRYALSHSLNVPAVKVAQITGYDKVARVAHAAGLKDVQGSPAMALGAYDVTPLEVAGAYTIFPNSGQFLKPALIQSIRGYDSASSIYELQRHPQPAIDPRAAYLVVSLMQDVITSGTGWEVRTRGFTLPAAGKTGSSRDGWFAGFTSKLICVVWVGFDDNRDIKLTGARTALPIWTEFMKRAHQHSAYRTVQQFAMPSGLTSAEIDATTGDLATPDCPKVRWEIFVAGTQPTQYCKTHVRGLAGIP